MKRTRCYCMLSIAAAMALSACASEAGGPRSSVPLGQSLSSQPLEPADALEADDDNRLLPVTEEAAHTGSQPRLGRDTVETIGSPQMTEVDATEEWRPSIQPRSRVTLVDSTTMPDHPFEGIVQLRWSVDYRDDAMYFSGETREGWHLWFYEYVHSGVDEGWKVGLVPLPDLVIDCVGDVGLVSHGAGGIEIGGSLDSVGAAFLVPWGGVPLRLETPSPELVEEIKLRPSNVVVSSVGDVVYVSSGGDQARYVLRAQARSDGEVWKVQARHDGDVFVMTVHPARHECFSGVTWLSVAETGDLLACGADTAATRYVNSEGSKTGGLELPGADDLPEYLECAYPLSHHSLQ